MHQPARTRRSHTARWTLWRLALVLGLTIPLFASAQLEDLHRAEAEAVPAKPPHSVQTAERLTGLPGLANVGRVAPGIYRGAQPRPSGYATLKKMEVRTVINLRARHSEKTAVEAAGMQSIEVPIKIPGTLTADTVRRVVALMADPNNQPVYVHCAQGQDRTGVAVAVYRMEMEGWTNIEAEKEMQDFGFSDIWIRFKHFVRHYRADGGLMRQPRPGGSPVTP